MLIYKRTPNKICNLRIVVDAGSMLESDPDDWGTAHFLEHMFFKGTTKRGYKEINSLASRLGDINAYTANQQTVFHLSFLADDVQKAADLLLEMVLDPALDEQELEKEKSVILQERETRKADPMTFAGDEFWKHVFGTAGHDCIGSEKSISGMSQGRIKSFRRQWYDGKAIATVLVGDVGKAPGEEIDRRISYVKSERTANYAVSLDLSPHHFHHSSGQSVLMIGWPGPSIPQECETGQLPDVVANGIGGGMHSLLFDRIREELGLCYSVGSYHASQRGTGVFVAYCLCDREKITQVQEEILKLIDGVRKNGLPDELLVTAKKNSLFGLCHKFESSAGIAQSADACFHVTRRQMDGLMDFEDRYRRIEKMTNADVIGFAERTFSPAVTPKFSTMTPA
jgi:predicted Zn-dependent peptidase